MAAAVGVELLAVGAFSIGLPWRPKAGIFVCSGADLAGTNPTNNKARLSIGFVDSALTQKLMGGHSEHAVFNPFNLSATHYGDAVGWNSDFFSVVGTGGGWQLNGGSSVDAASLFHLSLAGKTLKSQVNGFVLASGGDLVSIDTSVRLGAVEPSCVFVLARENTNATDNFVFSFGWHTASGAFSCGIIAVTNARNGAAGAITGYAATDPEPSGGNWLGTVTPGVGGFDFETVDGPAAGTIPEVLVYTLALYDSDVDAFFTSADTDWGATSGGIYTYTDPVPDAVLLGSAWMDSNAGGPSERWATGAATPDDPVSPTAYAGFGVEAVNRYDDATEVDIGRYRYGWAATTDPVQEVDPDGVGTGAVSFGSVSGSGYTLSSSTSAESVAALLGVLNIKTSKPSGFLPQIYRRR